ncbi:MAG TPA: ABC transporter permease [Candidatus Hydrogenedentes bacterium]|nr:ABC transporter permease [Candidatus Hydrogenedentota bacterium]
MFRGLYAIIYKETRHILRDPKTLFLMLLIPMLELTIFGYAVNLDVKNIPTVVYNLDGREPSRKLVDAFVNTGYFTVVGTAHSDAGMYGAIVAGNVKVGIKIPPDFTDTLVTGTTTKVQVLIDGSDSTSALQALNTSNAIAFGQSIKILSRVVGGVTEMPLEVRPRILFNPDMKTANFMIPGLVGVILQVVIMLLTAFAIVREKEQGTLEQLMVTPVSRLGLILGKLVPYGFVGICESISVLFLMRTLFQVQIAGNILYLAGFTLIFLFTTLSLGLLISTFTDNQIQALQFSFLILLPSFLLSGFMFPQETMPAIIYWIGQVVPATYFIRILRGIILRDAPLEALWHSGLILACMGVCIITLATLRFRKTLA